MSADGAVKLLKQGTADPADPPESHTLILPHRMENKVAVHDLTGMLPGAGSSIRHGIRSRLGLSSAIMAQRPGDTPPPSPTVTERQGYLEAGLQATTSVSQILRQFDEILQICIARKPARLFVDFSTISGKFSTLERYDLGMIGSRLVPHVGRVAVLVSPEVIDPEKFAAQVARNRGLNVDNFTDRAEALAWLLGP